MTYNHALIRHAINAAGFHIAELAYRTDIAVNTLDRILDGEEDPGDLRVAALARLAEALGLPLRALLAPPDQPGPVNHPTPTSSDDAGTLVAAIYDRGSTPTLNTEIAAALNWDMDRLHDAFKEADQRLRPAGLRIARAHGEAAIVPLHDRTEERRRLNEEQAAAKGLNLSHYKAVYSILKGKPWLEVSDYNAPRRRLVAGALINDGILTGSRTEPTVTDAVRFGDPSIS